MKSDESKTLIVDVILDFLKNKTILVTNYEENNNKKLRNRKLI